MQIALAGKVMIHTLDILQHLSEFTGLRHSVRRGKPAVSYKVLYAVKATSSQVFSKSTADATYTVGETPLTKICALRRLWQTLVPIL